MPAIATWWTAIVSPATHASSTFRSPETPVLFTITANARERSFCWAIEFDLIVNGRTKTYRVPESGFFRTVASESEAVVTRYERVDKQWVATL
jgi:hypothetical protein